MCGRHRGGGESGMDGMDESSFVVRQPKIFLWIGIICAFLFCALIALMTIFPNETNKWWVYLIFLFFMLLGLFVTYSYVMWELRVEGNRIIYSPSIGKKKSLTIDRITKIKVDNDFQKIVAFNGNKRIFSVEFVYSGFNILVSYLEKEKIPFE
jgi:uncharacterized membrane protein YbhN (UPF0104 family)